MNAGAMTAQALLNCLIREVSGPEQQVWEDGEHVRVRLARSGRLLRARVRRPSAGLGPRLAGEVEEWHQDALRGEQQADGRPQRQDGGWRRATWERLADLMAAELTLATGLANTEFASQVRASHQAMTAIAAARAGQAEPAGPIARYLASEQALVGGHRFHPSPKARSGEPAEWLGYAPEAGAAFPLEFLGVRADVIAAEGDTASLDRLGGPAPPEGYVRLPVHPWQLRRLLAAPGEGGAEGGWLARALRGRLVVGLGPGEHPVVATSSVRTVYDTRADLFCKFSLSVRITNCVRTSAWYELAASPLLTRLLGPVFLELAGRYPGTVLLGEPGYRTVAAAGKAAFEGLAVIVREGLRDRLEPGVTPLLAASLCEPVPVSPDSGMPLRGRPREWLLAWWRRYLARVAPPVLDAFFSHGVVLEPHLQNVLVGLDADGMPAQAFFRDLEGVKLVAGRHAGLLAGLPPAVAARLGYERERGWNRVAYCLLVNNLAEVAAAIADQHDELERELWDAARGELSEFASAAGHPPELRALLAGVPLPAKANLRVRWARSADMDATYVPVRNPLGR